MLPLQMGLLAWLISGFMAALFLAAALHKWQDPMEFYAQVDAYRLLPTAGSWWLSKCLPWLEALLAVSLLVPMVAHVAAWVAAALLLVYAGAMAVNLVRGRKDLDCGCGGPSARISWKLVVRNALMALAVGVVSLNPLIVDSVWDAALTAGCGILMWMVYALYEKVRSVLGRNQMVSSTVMKS